MPETIMGVPLSIMYILIITLIVAAFAIFYIFTQKGSLESNIALIGGTLRSLIG